VIAAATLIFALAAIGTLIATCTQIYLDDRATYQNFFGQSDHFVRL